MISFALLSAALSLGQVEAQELYQDLRRQKLPAAGLRLTGPFASKYSVPEDAGLRIALPAKREKSGPVGLQNEVPITGDFEIIGSYELLAAESPTRPSGVVGVNLYIVQGDDGNRFAKIVRYTPRNCPAYGIQHTDRSRQPTTIIENFPTDEKAGQLCLKREGNLLTFLVKDATTEGTFKKIFECEFGWDDLSIVRYVVNTGEEPLAVDARLVDLRIRYGKLAEGAPAVEPPSTWLRLLPGILGVVVLGTGAAVWLLRRRTRDNKEGQARARLAGPKHKLGKCV